MAVLRFAIVSQARPTDLSADRFEYMCLLHYYWNRSTLVNLV